MEMLLKNLWKSQQAKFFKCSDKLNHKCDNRLHWPHMNYIFEIKYPFPNPNIVPVHYNVPRRYISQLLSWMKVKYVNIAIYISHSAESTTFVLYPFDDELWTILWAEVQHRYDTQNLSKPTHVSKIKDEIITSFDVIYKEESNFLVN